MRLWRLVRPEYAPGIDGIGARRAGGRWNSQGVSVVYSATSVALATLETFVHLPPSMRSSEKMPRMSLVTLELNPKASIASVDMSKLPAEPTIDDYRNFGDTWVSSGGSVALRVPSLVVPQDYNVLLNPAHAEMEFVKVVAIDTFAYDGRLS